MEIVLQESCNSSSKWVGQWEKYLYSKSQSQSRQNKWNQKLSTWQDSNQGAEGSEAKALATWPIGQILMKQKDRLFRGMKGDEVEVRNRSTFPNKNHAILKSVFRNVCFWIFVKHYALVELQERARQSRWPGWPQANFRSPRHAWAIWCLSPRPVETSQQQNFANTKNSLQKYFS